MKLSVVVPTYREAENLPHLARALAAALGECGYEVIIADDDSQDGTDKICEALARDYPLRLLSRKQNPGLAAAVIDGIAAARGELVAVMDADLSHPADKIPEMTALLESGEADFVIGSRYIQSGSVAADWSRVRRLLSWVATLFVRPLVSVRDPMSGFFALKKSAMPGGLSPVGYKIGLEILVKAGFTRLREVPIHFRDRRYGESKLTIREQVNYLRHLGRLYRFRYPRAASFILFCAAGGCGLAADLACYYLLQAAGAGHLAARAASFWPAVTVNWLLNRRWAFADRPRVAPARQWFKFAVVCAAGFGVNWGCYAGLTANFAFFDSYRILAFLIGVGAGLIFNYAFADRFVFAKR